MKLMNISHLLFLTSLVFTVFILPVQAYAVSDNQENEYRNTLITLIQVLQQQVVSLQAQIDGRPQVQPARSIDDKTFLSSVDVVSTYFVDTAHNMSDIKNQKHQQYFERVFELFPETYSSKIRELIVFDSNKSEVGAFVETIPPEHDSWIYAVGEDELGSAGLWYGDELMVHELGHIISYETMIGVPTPAFTVCEPYFNNRGCPKKSSYLSKFVDKFWSDSDLSRADRLTRVSDVFTETYSYYQLHESEFVSDYAAQSPEEDFSETFLYFVLGEEFSVNSVVGQKISFFKQYSELVRLKNEINADLY